MSDINKIDSIPDPRKKTGDKDSVNPDKFQKALKVEKADETDKREKRNRPRKQEELDDEQNDVGATIPVPTGLFKEYMSEDEKKASILDAGSGSSPHLVSDKQGSSEKGIGYIPEMEEGAPSSKLSVGVTDNTSSEPNPAEDDVSSTSSSSSTGTGLGSEDDNPPSGTTVTDNAPPPPAAAAPPPESSPAPTQQEGYEVDLSTSTDDNDSSSTDNGNQSTTKKTDDTKKKKSIKKPEEKKKSTKSTDKKTKIPTKVEVKDKGKLTKTETKEEASKTGKPEQDIKSKVAAQESMPTDTSKNIDKKDVKQETTPNEKDSKSEKVSPITSSEGISGSPAETHSDNKESQGDEEEVTGAPAIAAVSPTGVAALQMSPFANMPKDVFELFEKMVGMMQVSKDNGKSITTVKLNMPNSIFDKCELILEHYDTAPNNYNVQFLGNPNALDRFAKNLTGLNNAITQSKLTFSIHLLPPKLSKSYTGEVSKLEKEKGDKEEKDGEETQK